jgi:hypothetical protein
MGCSSLLSFLACRPCPAVPASHPPLLTAVPVRLRYTVGKIPKAFKIIPNLKNWEEVLYLTDPEGWSPQAMFEVGSRSVLAQGRLQARGWGLCLRLAYIASWLDGRALCCLRH